jgi:hypothetical protein
MYKGTVDFFVKWLSTFYLLLWRLMYFGSLPFSYSVVFDVVCHCRIF